MICKLVNKKIENDWGRQLLAERGVEDLDLFLCPDESCLQSYTALENIQVGVDLVKKTVNDESTYGLLVDCDVDGFTSAAIIYQYIKALNPSKEFVFYLHDGKQHGLEDMVDQLITANHSLLFAPDSSSNDDCYAAELSFPVLALDHHIVESKETIAPNLIVINNQTSPNYRNKALTGAGVVYQFCRALDAEFGIENADRFIDLAALGIVADMASVLELENRYIIVNGFNSIQNKFFKGLLDKQSYSTKGAVTPISVAFYIVPLINAMIRMGSTEEKSRLFTSFIRPTTMVPSGKRGSGGALTEVWEESVRECVNAKAKQTRIRDKAVSELEMRIFKEDLLENQILLIQLEDEDYPQELTGLLAMNLAARYNKPTLLGRSNGELIRGSIRGLNDSALHSLRDFLLGSGLFEYVQGHDNAAGFGLLETNLHKFLEYAEAELVDIDFGENCFNVNFEVGANDDSIVDMIYDITNYFDVWGTLNDTPNIYIKNILLNEATVQVCGAKNNTVRFNHNGVTYIMFSADDLIEQIGEFNGKSFYLDVVATANLNEFRGSVTPQMTIKGYEIKELDTTF